MTDSLTKAKRSWNMSRIRSFNTQPEKRVRACLHGMGYRFRLDAKDIPGKPDVVLRRHRTAVFVHGCFWHRHPKCRFAYVPKSNVAFWRRKFRANVKRDREVAKLIRDLGWDTVVIWECQTRDTTGLDRLIRSAMPSKRLAMRAARPC